MMIREKIRVVESKEDLHYEVRRVWIDVESRYETRDEAERAAMQIMIQDDIPGYDNEGREIAIRYQVRLGCAPDDQAEEFASRGEAEARAVEWARQRAKDQLADNPGDLPDDWADTVEIYGGPLEETWGACPEDDDGAGYPEISLVAR